MASNCHLAPRTVVQIAEAITLFKGQIEGLRIKEATLWRLLRFEGVKEKIEGYGRLLYEF